MTADAQKNSGTDERKHIIRECIYSVTSFFADPDGIINPVMLCLWMIFIAFKMYAGTWPAGVTPLPCFGFFFISPRMRRLLSVSLWRNQLWRGASRRVRRRG